MATDLSTQTVPFAYRITLGDADDLTEVTLPGVAYKLSIQFVSNAGKIAFTGTDGSAIGSHYASVAADSWAELAWRGGATAPQSVIYLASGTGSTVVELLAEVRS